MHHIPYVEQILARANTRPHRVVIQDSRGELSALQFRRRVIRFGLIVGALGGWRPLTFGHALSSESAAHRATRVLD